MNLNEMTAWLNLQKVEEKEFYSSVSTLPIWARNANREWAKKNELIDSILAALSQPSEEERKEMLYLWENLGKLFVPGSIPEQSRGQLRDFPVFKRIRDLILGYAQERK
jgi:hypothetical protein